MVWSGKRDWIVFLVGDSSILVAHVVAADEFLEDAS